MRKELTGQQEPMQPRWRRLLDGVGQVGDNLLDKMAHGLMRTHEAIGNLYQGTVEVTANSAIVAAGHMLDTYDSLFGFTGIENGLGLSEAERDILLKRLIATHIVSRFHAPLAKGALGALEDFVGQRATANAQSGSRDLIIRSRGKQRSYTAIDMIEADARDMINVGIRTDLVTQGYSEDRIEEIEARRADLDTVATALFADLVRKRGISSFDDINSLISDLMHHANSHRKEVRRIVNEYRLKTHRDEIPEPNLLSWFLRRGR